MYCPNCGQQQMSGEMRFCSRCGLALTGLAEWVAGGSMLANNIYQPPITGPSPRRKHIRRAAKLLFVSGVLFPIFIVLCAAIEEGAPMILPFTILFASLVWMLYARLFIDDTPRVNYQAVQTAALGSMSARGSLPPPTTTAIPVGRPQVRTNELAQRPSVTEHTTRLFDNE